MIYRDPKCVLVANNPAEADIVAGWLSDQGVSAQVMNRATLGGLEGLTPFSPLGVGTAGLEVWVEDPAQAPEALRLLAEHAAAREAKGQGGQPITVACDRCGARLTFAAAQRGSTQECEHCGAYVDVESATGPRGRPHPPGDEGHEAKAQAGPAWRMGALRPLRRPIALLLLAPVFLMAGLLMVGLLVWLVSALLP
jgi:hypothetical protein